MDKIATNNFIVVLRKDVKNAKSMVAGNLVRKIKELKKNLDEDKKADDVKRTKIETKVAHLCCDIKVLKDLDTYQICKRAILKHDADFWKRLISDSKASKEEVLTARVISKGKVQKEVDKFRSDHPDCQEWLEEYFEFREKKRQLTDAKLKSKKSKQNVRHTKHSLGNKQNQKST